MQNTTDNTSGQGKLAVIPDEIKRWNWGAFFLSVIWAVGNNVWIGLLVIIPLISPVMMFILAIKGNEWAWRNKKWESVEHFKKVQRTWTVVAVIIIGSVLLIVGGGLLTMYKNITGPEQTSPKQENNLPIQSPQSNFIDFNITGYITDFNPNIPKLIVYVESITSNTKSTPFFSIILKNLLE